MALIIGVAAGTVAGVFFGNLPICAMIGTVVGVLMGSIQKSRKSKKPDAWGAPGRMAKDGLPDKARQHLR